MTALPTHDVIDALPRTTASDVKKLGWRSLMKTVGRNRRVVVTNHNEAEAVILSVEEYTGLMQALQAATSQADTALDTLRSRFDQRLQSLAADDAGERLRSLLRTPARLGGTVAVGSTD